MTRSRRDAARAWREIAKVLASSDDVEDRKLGQSIVNCARWLPGIRYNRCSLFVTTSIRR